MANILPKSHELTLAVLGGRGYKEVGRELNLTGQTIRVKVLGYIRKYAPELYRAGMRSNTSGTYATPALKWLRLNSVEILQQISESTQAIDKQREDHLEELRSIKIRDVDQMIYCPCCGKRIG